MVQLLRIWAFTSGGMDSIPGKGTKIPQASWHGQKQNKTKKTSHINMGMLGSDKTILFVHKIHTCT